MIKQGFRITYQIVSPESAEQGDYEETGWYNEEGDELSLDNDDIEEGLTAINKAVSYLKDKGIIECSSSPRLSVHDWFIADDEQDYRTGNCTTYNYHPVGYTEEELNEIKRLLKA
jgi:hypothetical protein